MEFLVHAKISLPSEMGDAARTALAEAEARQAAALAADGTILRLWRVPGQRANWGLWAAQDATVLHAAICTLPMFPYMDVDVHPLARHASDPLRDGGPADAASDGAPSG